MKAGRMKIIFFKKEKLKQILVFCKWRLRLAAEKAMGDLLFASFLKYLGNQAGILVVEMLKINFCFLCELAINLQHMYGTTGR